MSIFSGILLIIAALILIAFVSYLLWDHSKKTVDTRPEDVENLAIENGWEFSNRSKRLSQLMAENDLGYMGQGVQIRYACNQKQGSQQVYIFDCFAATPISGVAIRFENKQFPPLRVAERLIINRLNKLSADTPIEPGSLPKFVRSKVLINAPVDYHDQICQLIAENSELQRLLKQRDLGYFCMNNDTAVFYFLTRYPADQRGFGKAVKRAEQILQLLGS